MQEGGNQTVMLRLCGTVIVSLWLCGLLFGQEPGTATLKVHVINARTGKALRNTSVFLSRDQTYPRVSSGAPPLLKAKTDAHGWASFSLEMPVPPDLFFAVPGGDRLCSPYQYTSEEILKNGVIGGAGGCDPKHKLAQNFSAAPGELVLFVKPYTRWELFKRELP